ncbi:hypothetical protein N9A79_02715 [Pirellulales bacterium]|nr:hypothetical protein [Pirellulales bacterium]
MLGSLNIIAAELDR